MASKIVVGADEAGRGLIIGPMVIGVCAIDEDIEKKFKAFGIKDSKKYTSPRKLHEHADYIKKNSLAWELITISAKTLNNYHKNNLTMDQAEADAFYKAITTISKKIGKITEYQLDNFQARERLKQLVRNDMKLRTINVVIIPKADSKYISVGAGSILARDQSLKELAKIRDKYGDFGSGSTSDTKTRTWLKNYYLENRSWSNDIIRTYWTTIENLEKELK